MDAHGIVDAVTAKPAGEGVWINTFTAAELHERADEIDPALPLAGVPFAVKDNIDVSSGAPGLVRVAEGGASIDVELWQLPAGQVGGFLTGIRAPLGLGRVALDDGAEVTGFLCEAYAADGAPDITAGGGWRNYRRTGENL